jgi:hypothetical protein
VHTEVDEVNGGAETVFEISGRQQEILLTDLGLLPG